MTETEKHIIKAFGDATNRPVALDDKIKHLNLDSLDLLEVAFVIEDRCDCEIPDMELSEFVTVRDVVVYVTGSNVLA